MALEPTVHEHPGFYRPSYELANGCKTIRNGWIPAPSLLTERARSPTFPTVRHEEFLVRWAAKVAFRGDQQIGRRSQVAKAADCKSAIVGSNPTGASGQNPLFAKGFSLSWGAAFAPGLLATTQKAFSAEMRQRMTREIGRTGSLGGGDRRRFGPPGSPLSWRNVP
jgi:hypothetical protein